MPRFDFSPYVVLLRRCSRCSRPFRPTAPNHSPVRVALFLGNIRAQTHLAKPNHCILIIRYFVSRPLFYVLYYLARLDSGFVSGNQCTYIILQPDNSPSARVP